jgi:dolichyl-phosphate beta-glucosyltransferase
LYDRHLDERSLSIVVPAFDEERRIAALLETVVERGDEWAAAAGMTLCEVIVVDDGSRDATPALLRSFDGLDGRLRVITFEQNRGKGAAVRAGMLAASGARALLTDVDLSTPLDDMVALAAELDAGADIAIGSRALPGSRVLVHQPAYREFMGKGFNVLLRLLTGLPIRDSQCGFKLFRLASTRLLFERQRVDGFAFDAEICVLAHRLGLQLVEVPVRWENDSRTHVHLVRSSCRMALDLVRIARIARRIAPGATGQSLHVGIYSAPTDAPE